MSIRQISVFLENRPGKLSEMTELLASKEIDMRALSLAETADFGIARLITNDIETTLDELVKGEFITKLTKVLAFEVPNEPGGLNRLLKGFNAAGVNIEYMYSCFGSDRNRAYMIFSVADPDAAEEALKEQGLVSLKEDEIELI